MADVARVVENLSLQIAHVDDVEVDEAERADAGRREVERSRRSQSAGADAQHLRGFELSLARVPDLRHDQMPAVSPHLVVRERGRLGWRDRLRQAAGDRRHDAERVTRRYARVLALELPDVFVVHVDVDEGPQPSVLTKQVRAKLGVVGRDLPQELADRRALGEHDGLLRGERPERSGNQQTNRHR